MDVTTTVLSLPVADLEITLRFYRDGLGFAGARVEEGGIIALELPNLSLFLIERGEFDVFSRRVDRETSMPAGRVASIISCAVGSAEEVDAALARAAEYGGRVVHAARAEPWGHTGYFLDPDEHLWELVHSARTP